MLLLASGFGAARTARAQTPIPTPAPSLSIADAVVTEGNSGFRELLFPVTLSRAQTFDVSASFKTRDITATASSDYTPQPAGQIVIKAGQTRANVLIRVTGDTVEERDETFLVQLGAPKRCAISDSDAIATVKDDDYAGRVSVSDVSMVEGNGGQKVAKSLVSLSQTPLHDLTVSYTTKDDSAKASLGDYITTKGALLFRPGRLILNVAVPVVGDTNIERDERCLVQISAPGLSIAKALGVVSILNDDAPPPTPTPTPLPPTPTPTPTTPTATPTPTPLPPITLSVPDVTVTEGNGGTASADFTVTLASPAPRDIEIAYAAQDGSATAPGDYLAASGTLRFPPGASTASFSVAIVGDTVEEPNESFAVEFSSPDTTLSQTRAQCFLSDDDYDGQVSILDASKPEGNAGNSLVQVTVSASHLPLHPIEVTYATEDGTARAGADYLASRGTFTLYAQSAPGTPGAPVTLSFQIVGDTTVESDETFAVQLAAPAVNFLKSRAVVTIGNDDAPPPPPLGLIAFQSSRSGNGDVWVMNGDGTAQTRLTTDAADDGSPGLSPDGKRVVFESRRGGSDAVWIMNADGTGQKKIFQQGTMQHLSPRFSPDGTKIVVLTSAPGALSASIYLLNIDGSGAQLVTAHAYSDTQIGFSPDGGKIVYTALTPTGTGTAIFVVGTNGTSEVALSSGQFFDFDPCFSPDGKKIAFASSRNGVSRLYVMNADGTGETALPISNFTKFFTLCYSPDGSKIAFSSEISNGYQICVTNANGSGATQLTTSGGYSTSWSLGTVAPPAAPPPAASPPPSAPSS